jgi:hypothetical protein
LWPSPLLGQKLLQPPFIPGQPLFLFADTY